MGFKTTIIEMGDAEAGEAQKYFQKGKSQTLGLKRQ
jgi:hypothetical protein